MIWNSLLDDLRVQQDYESFRQRLKTWLFSSYAQRIRDFVTTALYKFTLTIPYHTTTEFERWHVHTGQTGIQAPICASFMHRHLEANALRNCMDFDGLDRIHEDIFQR